MKSLPERLKCKISENKIWAKTELNCEQKEVLRQKLDYLWIKEWIWLLKKCSTYFQNDFIFGFVSYILIICWFLIATNLDPLLSKKISFVNTFENNENQLFVYIFENQLFVYIFVHLFFQGHLWKKSLLPLVINLILLNNPL